MERKAKRGDGTGIEKGEVNRITGQSESPMKTRSGKGNPMPNRKKNLSLQPNKKLLCICLNDSVE